MDQRLAYPVTEAAQQVGISRSRLYQLRNQGQISFTQVGGRVVVKATELKRWLESQPSDSDINRSQKRRSL